MLLGGDYAGATNGSCNQITWGRDGAAVTGNPSRRTSQNTQRPVLAGRCKDPRCGAVCKTRSHRQTVTCLWSGTLQRQPEASCMRQPGGTSRTVLCAECTWERHAQNGCTYVGLFKHTKHTTQTHTHGLWAVYTCKQGQRQNWMHSNIGLWGGTGWNWRGKDWEPQFPLWCATAFIKRKTKQNKTNNLKQKCKYGEHMNICGILSLSIVLIKTLNTTLPYLSK